MRFYLAAFTALPRRKSDSVVDLRRIFHGVVSTVGALEGIGRPISDGTDLFVHLVVELLDSKTRRDWENSLGESSELPLYTELRAFLQEQLTTQKELRAAKNEVAPSRGVEKSGRAARTNHTRSRETQSARACPMFQGDHFMEFCEQYKKKSSRAISILLE